MPLRLSSLSWIAIALVAALGLSCCQTVHYYAQAVHGTAEIHGKERSRDEVIEDPSTPEKVKTKLKLARSLCDFAGSDLRLPAAGQYTKYADLGRRYVVWNVFAAKELSLESKTWWYPILGRLAYRGYFAESEADAMAKELRGQNYDVFVGGIEVYSTLGFFRDPLLNTFIDHSEPILAENLFHELGHQRLFVPGDTDFNEAYATSVGQAGTRLWLKHQGNLALLQKYEKHLRRQQEVVRLFHDARDQLAALYGDERTPGGSYKAAASPPALPREEMLRRKKAILTQLENDYTNLTVIWGVEKKQARPFDGDLNNARLNSMATYHDLVPAFEKLREKCGDWDSFYKAVEKLGKVPKEERKKALLREAGVELPS